MDLKNISLTEILMMNKEGIYQTIFSELSAVLEGETHVVLKMSTINCLIKTHFPDYFWVGFYLMKQEQLMVGPYQGTLGCLHIPLTKGICGRAAREKKTQIVDDVLSDPQHIACDSATRSEIVVPVFNHHKELIAVLDIDSTQYASFDQVDRLWLEKIVETHFATEKLDGIVTT